jgi:transcriptional regulator with XRE-family HTH domain
MAIDSGQMIKKLRKDMGLTQAELAGRLLISQRHVARLESNETRLDVWQFVALTEIMGQRTEDFWLLYLDTEEYEHYIMFKRLKLILRNKGSENEVAELVSKLKDGALGEKPLLKQFLRFAEIEIGHLAEPAVKETGLRNSAENPEDMLAKLDGVLRMSIPDFDESQVHTYRLTYNERAIIAKMANVLRMTGEIDKAIGLAAALVDNVENSNMSHEDIAATLPNGLINLATMYGMANRIDECLACNERLISVCREYKTYRFIPQALQNKANCLYLTGKGESDYKPLLLEAYYSAKAMGDDYFADFIKDKVTKTLKIADFV